ncbi:MAG: hypothetical protein IT258_02240, partial [Saprospiraceae bacterium]|nr:hypothetical protein [Saprospiraceae bacterium]
MAFACYGFLCTIVLLLLCCKKARHISHLLPAFVLRVGHVVADSCNENTVAHLESVLLKKRTLHNNSSSKTNSGESVRTFSSQFGRHFLKYSLAVSLNFFMMIGVVDAQCTISSGTSNEVIAASGDDASQAGTTTTINGNTLTFMSTANMVGLRFTSVAIPQGATITNAYLELTASANASTTANPIWIYGQSIGNAPIFTTGSNDISNRALTNDFISWKPGNWTSGTTYQSPNLKYIIQEIVNISSWSNNNNLALVIKGVTGTNTRTAHSFDGSGQEPRLVVNWQLDAPITTSVFSSACFDSNGNTAGGTSQTKVQVVVDWRARPGTEDIILKLQGQPDVVIDPDVVSKPYTYTYTLTADGSTKTLDANWSTTTGCAATQKSTTLPSGNCLLAPCQAGNTGGKVWLDYDDDGVKDASETQGLQG